MAAPFFNTPFQPYVYQVTLSLSLSSILIQFFFLVLLIVRVLLSYFIMEDYKFLLLEFRWRTFGVYISKFIMLLIFVQIGWVSRLWLFFWGNYIYNGDKLLNIDFNLWFLARKAKDSDKERFLTWEVSQVVVCFLKIWHCGIVPSRSPPYACGFRSVSLLPVGNEG